MQNTSNPLATVAPFVRPRDANILFWSAAIFLAALTVKSWQEVAGVRVLSTLLPVFFFMVLMRAGRSITAPKSVVVLLFAECIALPAVSIAAKGQITFYELYLPWTCLTAVIALNFYREFISNALAGVGELYAKSLIPICVLSLLFTWDKSWFGAYTLTSLSDFSTYFALQISIALPFVRRRGATLLIVFFVIMLWFLFSRLSLVLSLLVLLFQRVNIRNWKSILFASTGLAAMIVAGAFLAKTSTGQVLASKLSNSFTTLGSASSGDGISGLNPSDLARVAYIATTLDSITSRSLIIGHGIKTNHEIIAAKFDPNIWKLSDEFNTGSTHNVYIEFFSDCGAIMAFGFLVLSLVIVMRLKRRGIKDPTFLSALTFFASYMFEGNYCTFFFQFFLVYFLWMSTLATKDSKITAHVIQAAVPA